MVRWLNKISKSDAEEFGEKSALLGEMSKFGFPIPRGFVISYDEFDKAMVELGPEIRSIISTANPVNFNSITSASDLIKKLFQEYEFSNDFENEIKDFYSKLHIDKNEYGNVDSNAFNFIKAGRELPFVSVRVSNNSSTPKHHSTQLNVKRTSEIISAIKKSWASIYSSYSILYRLTNNSPFPRAAILIQEMVNASKSGDLFSANPINGNGTQVLIHARWGLTLKSSPGASMFICDKQSAKVIESHESKPNKYYTKDPQDGTTALRTLEEEFKNIPVLGQKELELLVKIAKDIENRVGFSVNIEWVIEKRKFHLIQVRPTSNLFKRKIFSDQFQNRFEKNIAKGIPASAGFTSNKMVLVDSPADLERFNPNNILVVNSFNGQLLPYLLQSSGIIFRKEDISSFGAVVARDFGKPCLVKTKVHVNNDFEQAELNASTGNVYGPEQQSQVITEEPKIEGIDLSGIHRNLESIEHEITALNAKLTEARSQNLLSEADREKSKLISNLEWEIRELKDKISQHLQ
ncbi:MAG: hypothetical protein CXT77_02500 [uncultured DHVE6 group euryarchaeote]|nr:MAG: hypothetical protein CXT77_02500 [uncultured DHVE6 group euryarchaeote]